ncbi:hypothetical protein ANN_03124, partial [Periplaneta americana]
LTLHYLSWANAPCLTAELCRYNVADIAVDERFTNQNLLGMCPQSNYIKTSKYSVLTFLPLNLFEQFQRLANFYFLCLLVLQVIPAISSLTPITTAVPLIGVLALTAVKDAYDDFQRHMSDSQVNNRRSKALRDGRLVEEKWAEVQVGDVIRMENDQFVAADVLLLTTSEPNGLCFIETAELDGYVYDAVHKSDFHIPSVIKKVKYLEEEKRKNNLIFFGIEEQVKEQPWDTYEVIVNVCWKWLDIDIGNGQVKEVYKIGNGNKRFILIRLANWMITEKIVDSKKALKDSIIIIEEDLNTRETNLKCRQCLVETAEMGQDDSLIGAFNGEIVCETPNNLLNKFEGTLDWKGKRFPLDNDKVVLRGCILRNTQWCYGVVIFAGKDTKLMQNSGKTKFKRTSIDRLLNFIIIGIYGPNIMSKQMVHHWCRQVSEGCQSVHDEERSGRPSLINDDCVELVRQCIMENRCFTITELSSHFPQISRSLLHEIVTKHLLFKKVCARWVPKNLTPEHKMQHLGAALTFLQRYHDDGDEFLDRIVMGDETWISHFTLETKQQSMHWWHSGSPVRTKFKQTLSVLKVMCMVFWDRRAFCSLTSFQECTAAVLTEFSWELFDHPPYSPDLRSGLAPSDFHVFLHLKKFLSSGERFGNDEELKTSVTHWFHSQAAEFYDRGIQNFVVVFQIVFFLLSMCLFCMIACGIWETITGVNFQEYLPWDTLVPTEPLSGATVIALLVFFSYAIVLNTVVPISLYVSVEVIRFAQSFLINWDEKMHYEKTNTSAKARTTTLNEELGQIEYIFSDKTGTLTQNIMTFNKCSIAGKCYGDLIDEATNEVLEITENTPPLDFSWNDNYEPEFRFYDSSLMDAVRGNSHDVHSFFRLLALCHTVMPEERNGKLEYQAQSPDEAALVSAARNFGFVFKERSPNSITIEVMGKREVYELLCILDFNNVRKRMSVILRRNGKLRLYCKGADNVIYERLKDGSGEIKAKTQEHLNKFAGEGLRTLCLAVRDLDEVFFNDWKHRHQEAALSLDGRDDKLDAIYEEIERNMTLIGVTAIEDKLQDGVPQTIANLALAGIKIWVLTGDKQETAINIGYSCQLLTDEMADIFIVDGHTYDDVETQLGKFRESVRSAGLGHGGVPTAAAASAPTSVSIVTFRWDQHSESEYQRGLSIEESDTSGGFAIVINGHSLVHALHPQMEKLFLEVSSQCKYCNNS